MRRALAALLPPPLGRRALGALVGLEADGVGGEARGRVGVQPPAGLGELRREVRVVGGLGGRELARRPCDAEREHAWREAGEVLHHVDLARSLQLAHEDSGAPTPPRGRPDAFYQALVDPSDRSGVGAPERSVLAPADQPQLRRVRVQGEG